MIILNQRQPDQGLSSPVKITKAPNYDFNQMLRGLEYYGKQLYPDFVIDNDNYATCEKLIRYFMRDPQFEKMGEKYSLLKGILLTGPVGTGKTDLMKAIDSFMANQGKDYLTFVIVPTRTIERDFIEGGINTIYDLGRRSYKKDGEQRVYCFDDLGLESNGSKYYGNNVSVMAEILFDRYDLGLLTHATTNLDVNSLAEIYGERIRSRMSEMFNLITLLGPDRRRK